LQFQGIVHVDYASKRPVHFNWAAAYLIAMPTNEQEPHGPMQSDPGTTYLMAMSSTEQETRGPMQSKSSGPR
jgi:hypothetical protein